MSGLTYDEYRKIWDAMSERQRQRVREKAKWERMTTWGVLTEWPSLRGTTE